MKHLLEYGVGIIIIIIIYLIFNGPYGLIKM